MKRNGFCVFVVALAFCCLFGISVYSFWNPQTVSTEENRALTSMPVFDKKTWFSGEFSQEAEDFFSDHILYRSWSIACAQEFETLMARQSELQIVSHDVDIGADIAAVDPSAADSGTFSDSTTANTTVSDDTTADEQQDYLILSDRILSLYQSDEANTWYYINTVNACFNIVPDYINKYLILAPSRIAFEETAYQEYSSDQKASIDLVYDNVDSLVLAVDCYTPLSEQDVDETYFRTDHHWSQFGSYFAAKALFDIAGIDYVPIEDYDEYEAGTFLGFLYAQNKAAAVDLANYPDKLEYYLYDGINNNMTYYTLGDNGEYVEAQALMIDPSRQGYYTFLESSCVYSVIDGSQHDGSCLLVVGDSYADALCTWLAQSFEKVVVLDLFEFEEGRAGFVNMIRNMDVTDFLIINHVNNLEHVNFTAEIKNLTQDAEG